MKLSVESEGSVNGGFALALYLFRFTALKTGGLFPQNFVNRWACDLRCVEGSWANNTLQSVRWWAV